MYQHGSMANSYTKTGKNEPKIRNATVLEKESYESIHGFSTRLCGRYLLMHTGTPMQNTD
jgi:hypothetical protein